MPPLEHESHITVDVTHKDLPFCSRGCWAVCNQHHPMLWYQKGSQPHLQKIIFRHNSFCQAIFQYLLGKCQLDQVCHAVKGVYFDGIVRVWLLVLKRADITVKYIRYQQHIIVFIALDSLHSILSGVRFSPTRYTRTPIDHTSIETYLIHMLILTKEASRGITEEGSSDTLYLAKVWYIL